MQVLSGVCSFSETDDFIHVCIRDEFSRREWSTQEDVLRELISQLLELKPRAIVLNLSALSTAGSAVVTAVVRIWKKIVAHGGRLVVLAPSPVTRSTLDFAGLNGQLAIADDATDALHQLGLSTTARLARRETLLLKCISPVAAMTAVASLIVMLLSVSGQEYQASLLFVLLTSAAIATGAGWIAAVREYGLFRHLSGFASFTGVTTLIAAIGHWTI